MGQQREPVKPCVSPVTATDMLLAQIVGQLGEIVARLSELVPPTEPQQVSAPSKGFVTEPAQTATVEPGVAVDQPKKRTRTRKKVTGQ